jgi:hypothetical protein
VIGYRAWYFALDRRRASLFPLTHPRHVVASPWDGANRDWVSASCNRFAAPHLSHDKSLAKPFDVERPPEGLGPELCVCCRSHDVPDEACSCGFYTTKTLAALLRPSPANFILGRVELAGKVIEYAAGYRAERARIVELIPLGGTEPEAIRLANRLELPLTTSVSTGIIPATTRGPNAA